MRKSRVTVKWTVGLLVFLAASASFAATAANTIPYWDGSNFISSFGVPNTQTYGQTVTVPAGESTLTSFRFLINLSGGGPIQAEAYVFAWDTVNSRLTGAALFHSAPFTISGVGYQPYNFTCSAPVTAGQVYVIFLTTSNSAQVVSSSQWAAVSNNTLYPGGQFVFQNNGTNFGNLSTVSWSTIAEDLAFGVAFGGASIDANLVPTLSGWMLALLGAGLALVGFIALRLRNA